MKPRNFGLAGLVCVCAIAAAQARAVVRDDPAEPEPAATPAPPATTVPDIDTADPLRGPSVRDDGAAVPAAGGEGAMTMQAVDAGGSLVKRDFQGKLVRLEVDPAQAALDLLGLTESERADTSRILTERAAIMDGLVMDNLKEIVELAGARQAGDSAQTRTLLRDLLSKYEPLQARGRLIDELSAALHEQKADALRQAVRGYYRAIYDDKKSEASAAGERMNFAKFIAAEAVSGIGQEVKRSYERVVQSRAAEFDKLLAELRLTPEQDAKVRQVVGDLFQKTYGKPTGAQRGRAFFEVWQTLDAEQRTLLTEKLRELYGVEIPSIGAGRAGRGESSTGPGPDPRRARSRGAGQP